VTSSTSAYRAAHPEYAARCKALVAARRRALLKLAAMHPAALAVLVDAECVAMGIEPPGSRPVGRPRKADR
jgi:hypothetical protein